MPIAISAFYFFYFASMGSLIIYAPNMLKLNGYNTIEIGVLFAILPLVRFLNPFLFLKLLKLDFNIIQISIVLNIISITLIYFTINDFYLLLLTLLLFGFSFNQFLPYMETIAMRYLDKDKYGKVRLFGSIGFIVIALVLPYFLSIQLAPIHAVSICSTIMFLAIITTHIIEKRDITKKLDINIDKFSLKKIWPFWVAIFLMQFSFGGLYNFFTIYAIEHSISLKMTSYLWTFGVICEIIMLYYQKGILNKYSLIDIMQFCISVTSIRWFIMFLYPSSHISLFVAQSLHAFSFALFHSACIFYLSDKYKNKELAQLFYLGISFGLGGFLGANFSGLMYGEWLFLYEAIVATIALLLFSKIFRERFKEYF